MSLSRQGNPDRYLHQRDGIYVYVRRVPKRLSSLDERAGMDLAFHGF
ncbi:hypothetical protein [Martelella mediterranea]|uniref:Uncharacterized protein n=1 Tax=Martelella mediterranea TaxID=293089 RepID=A0A4R3NFS1_9HYPH|nr:hypothetical protein [Martelella mediterranea]TCT29730.1 hypothetical protein EDC90_10482 [Martelella mediterranea]